MDDSCIVCLGSFNHVDPPPLQGPPSPSSDGAKPVDSEEELPSLAASKTAVLQPIAHLIPCGHEFHDDCLRPWVERANSCPICRRSFNCVQLSDTVGGPIKSSYEVADRVQEAEIDPSMYIDEPEEEIEPCPKCGRDDNEDVLLLCEDCNGAYHTYCIGLDSVPDLPFFCENCEAARMLPAVSETQERGRPTNHQARRHPQPPQQSAAQSQQQQQQRRPANRRTRGQVRRMHNQDEASSSSWARVWQSVWDRLNIDLDFPFEAPARRDRNTRRREGIRAWERRVRVAERQGGANNFREAAPAIFDRPTLSRPRPEPPRPESTEEILAWNALEKARDIQADPPPRSRKRKSPTTSPTDEDSHPRKRARRSVTRSPSDLPAPKAERPLKRPNTRRAPGMNIVTNGTNGESSRPRQRSIASMGASSPDGMGNTPTFLQSLLREVESSAVPDEPTGANGNTHSDHPSPPVASPGASPAASNHPSPGGMSGTPPISPRSLSPVPLTSRVEPVYPPAPDLNYEELSPMGKALRRRSSKSQTRVPQWVMQSSTPPIRPRARSEESSPTRANMSLSAKEGIQKLVREALRGPYANNQVNKDEYTEINRKVSRRLYEMVGENGIADEANNLSWQHRANEEVEKAIASLSNAKQSDD